MPQARYEKEKAAYEKSGGAGETSAAPKKAKAAPKKPAKKKEPEPEEDDDEEVLAVSCSPYPVVKVCCANMLPHTEMVQGLSMIVLGLQNFALCCVLVYVCPCSCSTGSSHDLLLRRM
jgi:hypothetical protein